MVPLGLCSIAGLAVFVERFIALRKNHLIRPEIVGILEGTDGEDGLETLRSTCGHHPGSFASLVLVCLEARSRPVAEAKELIGDAARKEIRAIQRGLPILDMISVIAPLLGLLGTVLGMIRVFQALAAGGIGQATVLSGGISEALVSTAVGLTVAIPAYIGHGFLLHRSEALVMLMEDRINGLLDVLHRRQGH